MTWRSRLLNRLTTSPGMSRATAAWSLFVVADTDAEVSQRLGEAGLKYCTVFVDLVRREDARVDPADAAVLCDDEVRNEIVQMEVWGSLVIGASTR